MQHLSNQRKFKHYSKICDFCSQLQFKLCRNLPHFSAKYNCRFSGLTQKSLIPTLHLECTYIRIPHSTVHSTVMLPYIAPTLLHYIVQYTAMSSHCTLQLYSITIYSTLHCHQYIHYSCTLPLHLHITLLLHSLQPTVHITQISDSVSQTVKYVSTVMHCTVGCLVV